MEKLSELKVGDEVTRLLAGVIPMKMKVIRVTEDRIVCNASDCDAAEWEFDRTTGAEIDEELGWGRKTEDGKIITGSFLKL